MFGTKAFAIGLAVFLVLTCSPQRAVANDQAIFVELIHPQFKKLNAKELEIDHALEPPVGTPYEVPGQAYIKKFCARRGEIQNEAAKLLSYINMLKPEGRGKFSVYSKALDSAMTELESACTYLSHSVIFLLEAERRMHIAAMEYYHILDIHWEVANRKIEEAYWSKDIPTKKRLLEEARCLKQNEKCPSLKTNAN